MSGAPIKEISCGKVKAAVWQGDYQGKPTYSVTLNKSYMKDGKWNNSQYFSTTDLRDLYILIGSMLNKTVKERTPSSKAAPQKAAPKDELQEAVEAVEFDDGVPF